MRSLCSHVLISLLFLFAGSSLDAEELTGYEIAVKVDQQQNFRSQYAVSRMTLVNKRGQKRIRVVHRWSKQYPEDSKYDQKTLIIFESPADVRNTALLMYSYKENSRDDDRWLYLPALKKVRRITARQKNDYFMGTDFTYDDMGDREVDEDNYRLLGEEKIGERVCYQLEAIPKSSDDLYGKRLIWVDKERFIPLKIEFFDRKGKLIKTMYVERSELIDGIWTARKITMDNTSKRHKTILELLEIRYNQEIPESKFTQSSLKRGL